MTSARTHPVTQTAMARPVLSSACRTATTVVASVQNATTAVVIGASPQPVAEALH